MAITTPIIAQPMKALACFMTTANSGLYVLAKGVLRHLQGVKFGNLFDVLLTLNLIFCNNAGFSWKAFLSSVLARSSAEAELIALSQDREISKDVQSISSFAGGFFITTSIGAPNIKAIKREQLADLVYFLLLAPRSEGGDRQIGR
jgi:hypothetical protein